MSFTSPGRSYTRSTDATHTPVSPVPAASTVGAPHYFDVDGAITTTAIAKRAWVSRSTVVRHERRLGLVPRRFLHIRVFSDFQADQIITAIVARRRAPRARTRIVTAWLDRLADRSGFLNLLADRAGFAVDPAEIEGLIGVFGDLGYCPLYSLRGSRWKGVGPGGVIIWISRDGAVTFSGSANAAAVGGSASGKW